MTIEAQAREILASLPERFRFEAESVRAFAERERWTSGDQAVELVTELHPRYPKTAIRMALAWLYHVQENTIRDREMVASAVPPELRKRYPSLTYHYWRACVHGGPKMIEYAEQIIAYLDAYGHLPRVETVYAWVNGNGDAEPVWRARIKSLLSQAEKIINDELTPARLRGVLRGLMAVIR